MAKRDDDDDYDADDIDEIDEVQDVDDDDDVEDVVADEIEPAPEEARPRKKPKVTWQTLTLCILNMLAAIGFIVLLMLNYERRQSFVFAAFSREFELRGVGTEEDKLGATAGTETLPRMKLSHEALKEAFTKRGGTTGVSEPFSPVEEGLRFHLHAGDISPEILREMMGDLGDSVGTIEEEMRRLNDRLPGDIQTVAKETSANLQKANDAVKRQKAGVLLYPLCLDPNQVEKLDAKLKAAQGPGLDKLVEEAVERRILTDILAPVEMFRPSDAERLIVEKSADLGAPIDDLRKLLKGRLEAAAKDTHDGSVHYGKEWHGVKRWTIEKRQNAAFLLVSVAFARKHLDKAATPEDQLLYPKGLERAQRISGLYDFTAACKSYNEAVRKLEDRVMEAIALDREGFDIQVKGEVKRSASFPDKHAAVIFRIRQVQLQIGREEERQKDLEQQRDRAMKLVEERTVHQAEVTKRIGQERAITKKKIDELRELQQQLFRAQTALATAAEDNAKIEANIRKLSGAKGSQQ